MPDQFYNLTLYEFRCLVARSMFENSKKWEHTRKMVHTLIAINSTKKVDILEIMPLLTDPMRKVEVPTTEEDRAALLEKAKERLRMLNK